MGAFDNLAESILGQTERQKLAKSQDRASFAQNMTSGIANIAGGIGSIIDQRKDFAISPERLRLTELVGDNNQKVLADSIRQTQEQLGKAREVGDIGIIRQLRSKLRDQRKNFNSFVPSTSEMKQFLPSEIKMRTAESDAKTKETIARINAEKDAREEARKDESLAQGRTKIENDEIERAKDDLKDIARNGDNVRGALEGIAEEDKVAISGNLMGLTSLFSKQALRGQGKDAAVIFNQIVSDFNRTKSLTPDQLVKGVATNMKKQFLTDIGSERDPAKQKLLYAQAMMALSKFTDGTLGHKELIKQYAKKKMLKYIMEHKESFTSMQGVEAAIDNISDTIYTIAVKRNPELETKSETKLEELMSTIQERGAIDIPWEAGLPDLEREAFDTQMRSFLTKKMSAFAPNPLVSKFTFDAKMKPGREGFLYALLLAQTLDSPGIKKHAVYNRSRNTLVEPDGTETPVTQNLVDRLKLILRSGVTPSNNKKANVITSTVKG